MWHVLTRVLAVDNDPKLLSLLRCGPNFAGYAIDLAANGEEALAAGSARRLTEQANEPTVFQTREGISHRKVEVRGVQS